MSKPRRELASTPAESDRAETLKLVIALGRALQALERRVAATPRRVRLGVDRVRRARGPVPQGSVATRRDSGPDPDDRREHDYVVKKLEERGLMRRKSLPRILVSCSGS